MNTSSVSIIVPYFNYKDYVAETLESILAQSVKPHEIIVIDDGSTDGGVEIIKKYPVKLIQKKNGGLASARNAGIKEATGKYIMSVDADDILRPDAIKEHLALADEKSIVTCGLMAFGAENYTARPEIASLELLLKRNCIYSNSLFPRQLAIRVGLFDESEVMRLGLEDWEMWIRMAKCGATFKTSDYIALLWRRHSLSMSTQSANPNWEIIMKYFQEKHKNLYELYKLK